MIDERAIEAARVAVDDELGASGSMATRELVRVALTAALPLLIGEGWRPIGELHAVVGDRIWAFLPTEE